VSGNHPARAWIAIGGNLGDRLETMRSAIEMIERDIGDTQFVASSPVYETRPVGPSTQMFLNAAIEVLTRQSARDLLDALHRIERAHERQRRVRWEARTLDLDLLAYAPHDDIEILREDDGDFVQPHPRAHLRDFVLKPLVDLGFEIPLHDDRTAAQLLSEIPSEALTIVRQSTDLLVPGKTRTTQ
jgi:2-amino-4-hydroxy-6-hydroxymethyldihydropteridine diphosphokinase